MTIQDTPSPVQDDRFLLLAALGRGGSASVFRAFDRVEQRIVALKVLSGDGQAGPSHPLSAEFDAWSTLRHRNVVRAYELGVARRGPILRDRPYLILEYFAGAPAHRALRPGRVSPTVLRRFAIEVLRGLEHVHAAGWIHHDVKPGNILVSTSVDHLRGVKLTDFGLAMRAGQAERPGVFSGSLPYVAPESLLGLPLDGRADLYGLGVLLFHMATGELPARTRCADALLRWHLAGPAADPRLLRPRFPAGLARFIRRLSERQRERRPESASRALALLGDRAPRASDPALPIRCRADRARLRLALDAARLGARRVFRLPVCPGRNAVLSNEVRVWSQVRGLGYYRLDANGRGLGQLVMRLLLEAGPEAARLARRYRLDRSLPLSFVAGVPIWDEAHAAAEPSNAADLSEILRFTLDRAMRRPMVLGADGLGPGDSAARRFVHRLQREIEPFQPPRANGGGLLLLIAGDAVNRVPATARGSAARD